MPEVYIGPLKFSEAPLILAPMEDITDPPFRRLCREMGADWVFTEFISADGLIRDAAKSLKKLDMDESERPVSIQIFGADAGAMAEAAQMAEKVKPDFIDINFGCPVRKVASKGAGSGIMNQPDKMTRITRRVVDAVKTPVSVKTRLGYDQQNKNIVDIAEALQDCGIQALSIHGRTRCQMYRGQADWSLIGDVKKNPRMHIPIIGNGDITDGPSARKALDNYGVDGIMIGRGAIGSPWVFKQIRHFLKTGQELPEPGLAERLALCRRHLLDSVQWKGERTAILEMRKHYSRYFSAIAHFKPLRMRLVTALTLEEIEKVFADIQRMSED